MAALFQILISLFTSHSTINPLNAELNPTCHLLALLAHRILHVNRIRVNVVAFEVQAASYSKPHTKYQ